jgi:hypothetical protein
VLRQPSSTLIGGFECSYDRKCHYYYRCYQKLEGYFVRKNTWKNFEQTFPLFMTEIRRNILTKLHSFLKPEMDKAKERHINKIQKRSDYQQIIMIRNFDEGEIERLVVNEFKLKEKEDIKRKANAIKTRKVPGSQSKVQLSKTKSFAEFFRI